MVANLITYNDQGYMKWLKAKSVAYTRAHLTSGGSSYSSMGSIEPSLWLNLVLRSIDDGPNGTPPW